MADHKSAPSTFRFQPHVKEALSIIADRDGRSMANMLEWLIKQHCERAGIGWPPALADAQSATATGSKSSTSRATSRENKKSTTGKSKA